MKKSIFLFTIIIAAMSITSCANTSKKEAAPEQATAAQDEWITLFDGTSMEGWRGYGRNDIPGAWSIDEGAIKISGSGKGEAGNKDGGDIIFDRKFQNFELSFEWKVSKGGNSGVFYLAQEIEGDPIWKSSPEYQILDNVNHVDARLGKDGNRQSASLYDLLPAVPQNSKPFGEWNTAGIIVYKGTVVHIQNGENVVEYHLWTDDWKAMVENSKFKGWENFINAGGDAHEGYIGLQDHGDDVWFRNIKVKILE